MGIHKSIQLLQGVFNSKMTGLLQKISRATPKVVLSLITIGILSGCGIDGTKYKYDGEIEGKHVRFCEEKVWKGFLEDTNYLVVKDSSGDSVVYADYDDDLIVDKVLIARKGKTREYYRGSIIQLEGEKKFAFYLRKILEIKQSEGGSIQAQRDSIEQEDLNLLRQ